MAAFRTGLLGAAAVIALSGCTSGFQKVRETVASAPDWYDERAAEVRGEGYPRVGEIPVLTAEEKTSRNLLVSREEVTNAERLFAMNPRSVPPGLELERMLSWAVEAKADASAREADPFVHITDEELARLKALFDIPRARTS